MIFRLPQLNKEFEIAKDFRADVSILTFLEQNKIPVARSCGAQGVCGTCRVYFTKSSDLPPVSDNEKRVLDSQKSNCLKSNQNRIPRISCLVKVADLIAMTRREGPSKTWEIFTDYW